MITIFFGGGGAGHFFLEGGVESFYHSNTLDRTLAWSLKSNQKLPGYENAWVKAQTTLWQSSLKDALYKQTKI